jgi:hypothetical protein
MKTPFKGTSGVCKGTTICYRMNYGTGNSELYILHTHDKYKQAQTFPYLPHMVACRDKPYGTDLFAPPNGKRKLSKLQAHISARSVISTSLSNSGC